MAVSLDVGTPTEHPFLDNAPLATADRRDSRATPHAAAPGRTLTSVAVVTAQAALQALRYRQKESEMPMVPIPAETQRW
jgi:hypothetical protein